ncbi:hydrogenase maturation protein [Methylocapsa polymorpha]|uniref:Hydrogenase maturation protein n=1 Tax=Methylocapsa polymorpha TaxID=3080828 RepID=A0ABZ0HP27_9HYPH|nr:hydrogenase maturation protein [Methylocapsa sp. RX1]
MRILFLTSAHNGLSQRLWIELGELGHDIRVCIAATDKIMIAAASSEAPDLIIAPMLKIAIPEEVWSRHLCLIVHPGIKGDRGPSSLDWAIANQEKIWGVTILEAADEFDTGPIWASHEFTLEADPPMKSSLYRGQVTEAAVCGVLEAVARIESGEFGSGSWQPDYVSQFVFGCLRPPMRQADRAIDWMRDKTAMIVRKIRAADGAPGVLSTLLGKSCFLYGAHEEERLQGLPGQVLARRDGAICVGTVDGAVWISHLKAKDGAEAQEATCRPAEAGVGCDICDAELCLVAGIKLPATQVLGPLLRGVPEASLPIDAPVDHRTFHEIVYSEEDEVGYLSFDFYNGAMSTSQCYRLRDAFLRARSRPTRVIVLLGGADFWSNGIHLNVIEASADPAAESWRNINAIDDLVFEILNTMSHLVIAGLRGNAGAGGVMLALAADQVYARSGVVLNPHYRSMGDLYGSEYWTYTLPRRVGQKRALELTLACEPIGARAAQDIGILDDAFGDDSEEFEAGLRERARRLAKRPEFRAMLRTKHERRFDDECVKPLASYRAEELARMQVNFFGPDPAYHEARRRFVFKGNLPPQGSRAAIRATVQDASEVLLLGAVRPSPQDASRTPLS